jgi:hypothetical protein
MGFDHHTEELLNVVGWYWFNCKLWYT